MATRHVQAMEGIVAKQRELVAKLEAARQPIGLALDTRDAMKRALELARWEVRRYSDNAIR
jgi:hypothetical protein